MNRYYYTLEDLTWACGSPLKGPADAQASNVTITEFLSDVVQDSKIAYLFSDTPMNTANMLFQRHIWPRYYDSFVGYVDAEDDISEDDLARLIADDAVEWGGRVASWLTGSIDKYNYIIDVYEGEITSDYKTLLDDVKTETTTMHNDTPQNEGDWLDFSHTSYATKISSSSNTNTKVARVEEILQAVRSIFETWCKEFGKFVFEV